MALVIGTLVQWNGEGGYYPDPYKNPRNMWGYITGNPVYPDDYEGLFYPVKWFHAGKNKYESFTLTVHPKSWV